MMKAIMITKENKHALEVQYEMDEGDLELCSGLYLVAGDGNRQTEGLLTKAALDLNYFRTGRTLNNGYFEVFPKAGLPTTPIFSHP